MPFGPGYPEGAGRAPRSGRYRRGRKRHRRRARLRGGGVPERPNGPDLKSGGPQGSGGSNPSPSAISFRRRAGSVATPAGRTASCLLHASRQARACRMHQRRRSTTTKDSRIRSLSGSCRQRKLHACACLHECFTWPAPGARTRRRSASEPVPAPPSRKEAAEAPPWRGNHASCFGILAEGAMQEQDGGGPMTGQAAESPGSGFRMRVLASSPLRSVAAQAPALAPVCRPPAAPNGRCRRPQSPACLRLPGTAGRPCAPKAGRATVPRRLPLGHPRRCSRPLQLSAPAA